MTGIAAAFDDGDGVASETVSAMLDTIDYRGHDGRDLEVRGPAGLGHQHFWTTPEAVGERQPTCVDGVVVAFDGRLDDREELLSALPGCQRPGASDAELVATAYREWGPAAFDRIVGVFAVVVYDERRERLVCARDPSGLRELYYSTAGDHPVAGSDPSTVLAGPGVPNEIDEGALGEYLVGEFGSGTVYAAVDAVEPGTYVAFPGGETTRFWDPSDLDRHPSTDGDELADRLASLLCEAVRARLRTRDAPHVLLSGGLDSTTVTAVATDWTDDLRAITMQFDDPDGTADPAAFRAERCRVEAFADEFDVPLSVHPLDDEATPLSVDAYADPRIELPALHGPEVPKRAVYDRIADRGSCVALTGELGNLFDGVRFSYFDLLREGQLRRAIADLRADPMPTRDLLRWFVLTPAFPGLSRWLLRLRNGDGATLPDWLAEEFVDRVNLDERLGDAGIEFDQVAIQQTYDEYYRTDQLWFYGQDRRRALAAGVEPRHPFGDRRLLEFLYALPPGARIRGGENKHFFRRLAADLLPDPVLDQSATFRFDPVVHRGLRGNPERLASLVTDGTLAERGIVDTRAVEGILSAYLDGDDRSNTVLWRLAATELWLRGSVTP